MCVLTIPITSRRRHTSFLNVVGSEEHTSELQSHSEISYAVFCLKKKKVLMLPLLVWLTPELRIKKRLLAFSRRLHARIRKFFFFFNDTATTEIYTNLNTLSLHDALPISVV